MPNFDYYKEKFLSRWENFVAKSDDEVTGMGRERIVVFIFALILALCLWLMVNLNRTYNLNVDLPISLRAVPEKQALSADLPSHVTVSVSGEGWKLINLYNNPPGINVDVDDSEVNMYDQVQQQMNALPEINVQKVQPPVLSLQLEKRLSKKVPVKSRVNVSFDEQYNFLQSPSIKPDSVTVSGAKSLVQDIESWETDSVHIEEVTGNLSRLINLEESGELISLSQNEIAYNASVAQFTEGQAKVAIRTRNAPQNRKISYSPSTISVKYSVPINEYNEIQDTKPFEVYVTYKQIKENSSGFVSPHVEKTAEKYHVNIRSLQPRQVAYFVVLGD